MYFHMIASIISQCMTTTQVTTNEIKNSQRDTLITLNDARVDTYKMAKTLISKH